jgi:two-component system LytT family response regulator
MYRAIIVDDESIGINTLKILIERYAPTIKIVATATEPEKGISLIEDYKPDIVFLDISMPRINGFELLDRLDYKNFKLVFTTAHEEYALKAIKNKAYDYLLKPIDIDELKQCVKSITVDIIEKKEVQKTSLPGIIEIAVKDGILFIKPEDIIRLEASGSYTTFHLTNNTKHVISKKLKDYEAILDPSSFYRCHNSHIINLGKVIKLVSTEGLYAKMSDDSLVEIARQNKQIFIDKLKNC